VKILLAMIALSIAQPDLDLEIKAKLSFERMKLKPYAQAVIQTREILFVWVEYEDLQVYMHLTKQYPAASHCFVTEFPAITKGIVIGRKTGLLFNRELDISSLKGVIGKIDQFFKQKAKGNHVETDVPQPAFIMLYAQPSVQDCKT